MLSSHLHSVHSDVICVCVNMCVYIVCCACVALCQCDVVSDTMTNQIWSALEEML